jgi:hypothetical protein
MTVNARWRADGSRGDEVETMDRTAAALNRMPMMATATAGYPTFVLGTRPKSDTDKALVNDKSAAASRTCWMTPGRLVSVRLSATVTTTKRRPVSPAAEVAIAVNRSR